MTSVPAPSVKRLIARVCGCEEHEFVLEAQRFCLERLRPGAVCADIWEAYNDFMRAHGRPPPA